MVTQPDKRVFAKRFNEALDRRGIPPGGEGRQKRVAKLFGVSQPAAWKWISGNGMPDTKKLPTIAKKLACSVEWLLGFDSEGPAETAGVADPAGNYFVSDDVFRSVAAELKGKYLEAWEETRTLDEAAYLLKLLFKIHGGTGYDNETASREPPTGAG